MPDRLEFSTLLVATGPGGGGALLLRVPRELLGQAGKVEVRGTVNGRLLQALALPDGHGGHTIALARTMQETLGARPGDLVRVVLGLSEGGGAAEPEAAVPPDFLKAVTRNVQARTWWKKLAPAQRRAWVELITEAKTPEVRAQRIVEAVQRISLGKAR